MTDGELTLKFLKKHILKTDKKWQENIASGHRWFPNQFSQDVELFKAEGEFIRIRTNVLEDVNLNTQNLQIIGDLLFTSTMSGLVYEDKNLSLYCQVEVREDSAKWMPILLGQAALLQIAEATYAIAKVAKAMETKSPYKEHPTSGPRILIDNFIEKSIFYMIELGKEDSKWEEQEFDELVNFIKPPAKIINKESKSLDIEFPFGSYASICKITSKTRHPRIGSGLAIIQSFPIEGIPQDDGIKLCLNLNNRDLKKNPYGYGFGSYCYRNGLFSHLSFIPNSAHSPNLLKEFYSTCTERAKRVSQEFTGKGQD